MRAEIHKLMWQSIEIELTYKPEDFGGHIAHLEVRSIKPERAPLPISETGYRSHFHPVGTVEANEGTLVQQVTAWLDEEAKSKAWNKYVEDSRQLSFFDI